MSPAPKADPFAATMATTQTRIAPKQPMLKSKYYQKPIKAAFAGALSDDDHSEQVLSPGSKSADTPTRTNGTTKGAQWSGRDEAPSLASPLKSAPLPKPAGENAAENKASSHRHTKSGGQVLDTAIPARKPVGIDATRSASVDTSSLETPQKSASIRKASEGSVVPKLSHKGRTDSLRDANKKSPAEVQRDTDRRRKDEDSKRASWDGEAVDFLQRSDEDEEDQPETPSSEEKKPPEPATPPKLPELKLGNLFSWEDENVEVRDFAKHERPLLPEFTLSKSLLDDEDESDDALVKSSDLLRGEKTEEKPQEENTTEEKLEVEEADDDHVKEESAKDESLKPAAAEDDTAGDKAEEPLKKRSPRPSPAPIDTSGRSRRTTKKEPGPKKPQTPPGQQKAGNPAESFLWNSPRSSADDDAKDSAMSPKPLDEELKALTPTKADRPGSTDSEIMSANALGFGAGPSDWEFLGDYDGEEVDDIHLYTSPKTQEAPPIRLPMITSTVEEVEEDGEMLDPDDSPSVPTRPHLERKILSTIEERASEHLEDLFNGKKIEGQQGETIDTRAIFDAHPPPPPPGEDAMDRGSSSLLHSSSGEGSQNRASVASSTDTIERISFHVPPPPESATSESSSKDSPARDRTDYDRDIPTSDNLAINNTDGAPLGPDVTTPKPVAPEDAVPILPSLPRTKSATQSIKTGNSSRVLSRVSDDGKEEIMISLEIPRRSPPPAIPESDERSPPNKRLGEPSPDLLRSGGRRSIYPGSIELENPYAGLEVWAKASLNRFIKVLHDEAAAKTNEEKYQVFVNLMRNEQRIRAVFYDQDEESDHSDSQAKQLQQQQQAQSGPLEESLTSPSQQPPPSAGARISKALPALPTEPEATPIGSPVQTPGEEAPKRGVLASLQSPDATKSINGTNEATGEPSPDDPNGNAAKQSKEKNLVNIPGAASLSALRKALDIVTTRKSSLTPKDTQAMARASILRASGQPGREEFKADVKSPNSVTSPSDATNDAPQRSETTSPVDGQHGDLSPTEGKPYEGDKAANRQSIYQPFSNMLRASSIRSGRSDGGDWRKSHQGHPSVSESANGGDENGFLSPQTMSPVAKGKRPANVRHTVLEPLVVVVPQDSILRQEPEALVRLRQVMDTIPDDFSFIHKTVLSWDAEAKKARERYESERHVRQGQNEQRIDELFNEHEIGYSDISRLEADFKRAEAAKKAEEDREEVQTFVASVFDVVWARINYEMDQLKPLYDECTRLVADASAGRGMFEEDSARVPIAPAMEALLILYQKLMVRHQKAFEAVLERDRRLKKVEVAPWYALGAVDKVKRIERRFEDAEKKAILEFCRQRDERANLLMDVLDQNTLRGVGANQDYMESVMQGVSKVSVDLAHGAVGDDDVVSTTEVLKAKTITTALARSSEQIVQTFHVADMLLNAADYEVSVANAKLIGADAAAFRRLRDAKAKEDQKLALDLEHRMGLIRGDTSRTQDEITKLLMLLQDRQGSKAAASALAESGMDPVHEEQLRKSLDAIVATKNGQGSDA